MDILNIRIKERRTALEMTLAELADKIGVRDATVQRYESGEIKNIKRDTVSRLAQALNCSPGYLMGWEDDPNMTHKKMREIRAKKSTEKKFSLLSYGGGGEEEIELNEEEYEQFKNFLKLTHRNRQRESDEE